MLAFPIYIQDRTTCGTTLLLANAKGKGRKNLIKCCAFALDEIKN